MKAQQLALEVVDAFLQDADQAQLEVAQAEALPEGPPLLRQVGKPGDSVLLEVGGDRVLTLFPQRRVVSLGGTSGDSRQLLAGVSPGEAVIVEAPADLKDGAAVSEAKP